jgi:hypothetical protein
LLILILILLPLSARAPQHGYHLGVIVELRVVQDSVGRGVNDFSNNAIGVCVHVRPCLQEGSDDVNVPILGSDVKRSVREAVVREVVV